MLGHQIHGNVEGTADFSVVRLSSGEGGSDELDVFEPESRNIETGWLIDPQEYEPLAFSREAYGILDLCGPARGLVYEIRASPERDSSDFRVAYRRAKDSSHFFIHSSRPVSPYDFGRSDLFREFRLKGDLRGFINILGML